MCAVKFRLFSTVNTERVLSSRAKQFLQSYHVLLLRTFGSGGTIGAPVGKTTHIIYAYV